MGVGWPLTLCRNGNFIEYYRMAAEGGNACVVTRVRAHAAFLHGSKLGLGGLVVDKLSGWRSSVDGRGAWAGELERSSFEEVFPKAAR